ncbi:hypothetical protein QBC44DRAFT_363601 [Cladorrhinum sp. PSN332]|nr:hypothetical protein QBC44DRAFT_363601 [Cladorrhinum sp. PSN332]
MSSRKVAAAPAAGPSRARAPVAGKAPTPSGMQTFGRVFFDALQWPRPPLKKLQTEAQRSEAKKEGGLFEPSEHEIKVSQVLEKMANKKGTLITSVALAHVNLKLVGVVIVEWKFFKQREEVQLVRIQNEITKSTAHQSNNLSQYST